jgi:hypothetical protein
MIRFFINLRALSIVTQGVSLAFANASIYPALTIFLTMASMVIFAIPSKFIPVSDVYLAWIELRKGLTKDIFGF